MFRWDEKAKRYRDEETGRFLSRARALRMAEESMQAGRSAVQILAEQVAAGEITPEQWRAQMRNEIKEETIRQYLASRGGRSQMTNADWGSVGGMVTEQYRFLEGFYAEVAAGNLSAGQIAYRSTMYIGSAREASERAHTRSQGMEVGALPAYPADGSTECLTNDRCSWHIEEVRGLGGEIMQWNAYWRLSDAEHCATCLGRAADWSPYVVQPGSRLQRTAERLPPDLNWDHAGSCNCGYAIEAGQIVNVDDIQ